MLEITSVKDGLVIDHIEVGFGIKIFNYLKLDKADYRVALIMNAESSQIGRKDLIKIEKENCDDIDFTMNSVKTDTTATTEETNDKPIEFEIGSTPTWDSTQA